jgi:hypothetical protein
MSRSRRTAPASFESAVVYGNAVQYDSIAESEEGPGVRIGRKWRWLLAGGLLWVLLLAALIYLPQRHPIDKATVDRIRPGMTRGEVETLLGGRWDAHTRTSVPGQIKAGWMGSEGTCVIVFDAEDRVVSASYGEKKWSALRRAGTRVLFRVKELAPD